MNGTETQWWKPPYEVVDRQGNRVLVTSIHGHKLNCLHRIGSGTTNQMFHSVSLSRLQGTVMHKYWTVSNSKVVTS